MRSIILNFDLKDLIKIDLVYDLIYDHFYFQNGGLSALPYLCMYVMSFPVSYTADLLVNSGRLSLTNIRRVFTLMGLGGPSVMFVALAFFAGSQIPATLTSPIFCSPSAIGPPAS